VTGTTGPDDPADDPADDLAALVARRFAWAPADVGPVPAPRAGTAALTTLLDHRVCRQFTTEPVDDGLLDLVLAATFATPSKSDLQQCSVIVVDDPGRRAALAALIPTMPWIATAARFLVFCGDSHRIRAVAERAGTGFANDHLDAFLNAAADAAMHLSTCIWAAEAVGLGTCPISVLRNHIDEVAAVVELPDHVFPLAGLCLGWPGGEQRLSPRLPLSVTVHRNRYDDGDAADRIADYDRRRFGDFVPPADRQPGVERFGVADRWGWSVEKSRMVAERERDQLARYLRERGFDLG
jgi:nitroreductase/FMN reductase [NAD(P)H]